MLIIVQIKKNKEKRLWKDFCYSNDEEQERVRQLERESSKEYRDRQYRLERERQSLGRKRNAM